MHKIECTETVELLINWFAGIPIVPLICLLSIAGLGIGSFLIIKPSHAIEIQKRFYSRINWRIEPISMQKELRNTRIMGLTLIAFSIITLFFILSVK